MHAKRDNLNQFFLEKIRDSLKGDDQENFVKEYVDRVGSDYDQMELVYILRDLIAAGTVTTATQLCWATILLGNHPEVLKHLRTELDAVVPRDRLPSMDDKAKLPYMEATILEVMRMKPVLPLVAYRTHGETTLRQYRIPAGTIVRVLLGCMHAKICI